MAHDKNQIKNQRRIKSILNVNATTPNSHISESGAESFYLSKSIVSILCPFKLSLSVLTPPSEKYAGRCSQL